MVQDQLLDYISSQLKLGVSREAVKTALVTAGWPAADVEETLKKSENSAAPKMATPAMPSVSPTQSFMASFDSASKSSPAAKPAGGEPSSIRVSDLISASNAATSVTTKGSPVKDTPAKISSLPGAAKFDTVDLSPEKPKRKFPIMMIVGIVLILGFGGLAGYFYFQDSALAGKVSSLGTTSASVSAQVGSLMGQVAALNTSNTALSAQVDTLTAENQALKTSLSFLIAPPGSAAASATTTVTGMLKGGNPNYVLTTAEGVAVNIANSKSAAVSAALKPLLASTSSVTLVGTHVPGSSLLTVTSVNGTAVQ